MQARIDAALTFGQTLVGEGHYAAAAVTARQGELQALWAKLAALSADKTQKLKEATEQMQFNAAVNVRGRGRAVLVAFVCSFARAPFTALRGACRTLTHGAAKWKRRWRRTTWAATW